MAAPAAGHVGLVDIASAKSCGAHPSAPPSAATRPVPLCSVPPMIMPPWPMMMPPWMPVFGMFMGKQNCGMPIAHIPAPMPGLTQSRRPSACPTAPPSEAKPQQPQQQQHPAAPASAPAAAGTEQAEDDDDMGLQPDDELVVEPDELEVFEKVAAMEQQKQQASTQFERSSSPTGSCRTTVTGPTDGCSPVSTLLPPLPFPPVGCFPFMPPSFPCMPLPPCMAGLPLPPQAAQQVHTQTLPPQHGKPQKAQQPLHWQQQAQQLCKPQPQQHGDEDAAPLPWSMFAADDLVDDIDKDLEDLIPLTDTLPAPAAAQVTPAAPNTDLSAPAAAAVMKTHNNSSSSLRRMSSSTSTLTCAVGAQGNAAATCAAADNNARTGCGTRRVLRLKGSTKGNTSGNSSSSSAAKGRAGTSNRITLKGSSSRRDAGPQQQHRQHQGAPAGATAGLGVKAVSLKKLAKTAELGSAPGAVTSKGTPGSKHAAPASIMPVQQPPATKACKDVSMSLLGDLDSSLSGGEALALDVQLTDDYWESIMQDTSDEGWDSLLAAHDLDLTPLDC